MEDGVFSFMEDEFFFSWKMRSNLSSRLQRASALRSKSFVRVKRLAEFTSCSLCKNEIATVVGCYSASKSIVVLVSELNGTQLRRYLPRIPN